MAINHRPTRSRPDAEGTRWAPLPSSSRRQQVVDLLRNAIVTGSLRAGEQLKQDWLSSDFGVSPGPIREALRQLESEGLVEHYPNKGVFVTDVSTEEFLGVLLPVRTAIETFGVPRAVERMDKAAFENLDALVQEMERQADAGELERINELDVRFHEATMEASGSAHALQLWHTVLPRIKAQIYRLSPRHQDLREIAQEHRRLLDAMRAGDPDALRSAIEHHIIGTAQELLGGVSLP
jgi:GntR family transcriptional regulator of gluconate operon